MKLLKMIFISTSLLFLTACDAEFDMESVNDLFTRSGQDGLETPGPGESLQEIVNREGTINDNGDIEVPVDVISKLCADRPQKQKTMAVRFDPPNRTCSWGQNGNLNPRNYYFQARIEQREYIDIPAGAIPCSADFDFPEQNFLYDDQFIFSMNRSIFAASFNFEEELRTGTNGLLNYEWSDLAGTSWDSNREEIYCPQIPNGTATCDFPAHDQQGQIEIQISDLHIESAMSNGLPQSGHYFQMTTIGDNDDLDCEHTGIYFNVNIRYIE